MYKKTFLDTVIVKVDFATPILQFDKSVPEPFNSKALSLFPIPEAHKKVGKQYQIKPEGSLEEKNLEEQEWFFHGKDREKTLGVSSRGMFVTYKIYKDFNDLKSTFSELLDSLVKTAGELKVRRLGLRYIDNIHFEEQDLLGWDKYLSKNLLSIFDIADDKSQISRAFHILEMNYGDMNLRFQYGMHNPDYPAQIRKKIFILDTDVYLDGIQTKDDINVNLEKFHAKARDIFEKSITKDLRGVMENG